MTQSEQIEVAIRELPDQERKALVLRLNDVYWDAWDDQLEQDYDSGALSDLIAEAESEIAEAKVKPLNEVIDNQ